MKTRIISGTVGALIVILAIILRTTVVFNIFIALITAVAIIESQVATKLVDNFSLIVLGCVYGAVSAFIPLFDFMPTGLLVTAIYVFACVVIVLSKSEGNTVYKSVYSVGITLLISFGMSSLVYINELYSTKSYMYTSSDSLFFLLFALGGAWFGDTGAYFVGSKIGKHKISPVVSPKKSLEGVFGSMGFILILMLILGAVWSGAVLDSKSYIQFGWLILVSLLCPVIGLVGDLFFSFIKRNCNIKDYGKLIPGHGGILDRFDSVIFVAPFIYLVLLYIPMIVHK